MINLKRARGELERKVLDQEDELDEQAGRIQQLEAARLRLEMEHSNIRQAHGRELDDKEQELEDLRTSHHKKVGVSLGGTKRKKTLWQFCLILHNDESRSRAS